METKIIKQEKNPFMEREEFILEITNEVTPSFDEVKSELKKDADLVVVKKINTNFGRRTFIVEVFVYDNKEAMKKVETIPKKIRKKIEADEKAAAAAAKKAEAETRATEEAEKAAKTETTTEETKEEEKSE